MSSEPDYQLTTNHWDALRALRPGAPPSLRLNGYVIAQLVALGLVTMIADRATLTATGRAVVLRGCPRLWDLAA